jgi:hypothetical protein
LNSSEPVYLLLRAENPKVTGFFSDLHTIAVMYTLEWIHDQASAREGHHPEREMDGDFCEPASLQHIILSEEPVPA